MIAITAPVLFWLGLATIAPPHPHHPQAIRLMGAGGEVTVTYFTVPYNAEHLKRVKDGFQWHLGYAMLNTKVPLKASNGTVAPGRYKLDVKLIDQSKGHWDVVLTHPRIWQVTRQISAAKRRGRDTSRGEKRLAAEIAKLKATGAQGSYTLAGHKFTADEEEHLTMYAINRGYATKRMNSTDGRSGMKAQLRFSFGDMHHQTSLHEVYPAPAKKLIEANDKKDQPKAEKPSSRRIR